MTLLITVLYIVFVLAAIILITVVLLQEGKGGGLGSALGESGQQTVGVGAKGINTFTGYVAGTFIVTALLLHILNRDALSTSILDGDAWGSESMQDALGGSGTVNPLEGLGLPPAGAGGGVPTDG